MKILLTGASGLVGRHLRRHWHGIHQVVSLVRGTDWDPRRPISDLSKLEGCDVVIHLAGESIAAGRWTAQRKKEIRDSRVLGTRHLSEALSRVQKKPRHFISASAIGFYGDRGSESLTEASQRGAGFLPDVCVEWEKASEPLAQAGVAVTHTRFGIILSTEGGALHKMLLPFKMGVGGILGSGRQFMSWIDIEDVVGVIDFLVHGGEGFGPINATAPYPVTNKEFTKTLGRVLSRPTALPMPAVAARLAFGEMADALLLSSAKVLPSKLIDKGFEFKYPTVESSLRHLLK